MYACEGWATLADAVAAEIQRARGDRAYVRSMQLE